MRRRTVVTAGALIAIMLFQMRAAAAILNVDTVLGPDHPYFDQTITVVDGIDPPTELTILPGTHVGESLGGPLIDVGVDAYGQSIVKLLNGGINGAAKGVSLHDSSVFHMQAGSVLGDIEARDNSEVLIDDGFWQRMFALDNSVVRIDGVPTGNGRSVRMQGQARAVINSGEVVLRGVEQSTVIIRGGFIDFAEVSDDSRWLINGGSFQDTGLDVNGGVVYLRAMDAENFGPARLSVGAGTVHVYGLGLRFDTDPLRGDVIVGQLSDGDPIDARYEVSRFGKIILYEVPEPGTLALLGLGALLLVPRWVRSAG